MSPVAGASVEWLCKHVALLRGGPGHEKVGDPYVWGMTLLADADVATLKLVVGLGDRELIRAGEDAMRREGFKIRRYVHNGRWREVLL